MKSLVALVTLVCASPAFGMIWQESIVASASDLQKKGFVIECQATEGVIRSFAVRVAAPKDSAEERFVSMALVIAAEPVSRATVEYADQHTDSRTEKKERDATFAIFGKQIERAFIVVDFECPDARGVPHQRRYLLPLADLRPKKEANQALEPTAPSGRGSS